MEVGERYVKLTKRRHLMGRNVHLISIEKLERQLYVSGGL